MADFIRRSLEKASVAGTGAPCRDQAFVRDYPALSEFMTLQIIDDRPRVTATVNISFADGEFRAFLNDRDSKQSLCVQAASLWGLFEALESRLVCDEPGWRQMLPDGSQTRKKRT